MLYRKRKLTRVVSEIRLSRCIKVATCFSSEIFCSPPKILVHVLLSKNSPLRVNFLAQKYFSLCGFLCRRLFFSMRVSSLKNLFLPIHFLIFFYIYMATHPFYGILCFLSRNAREYRKSIHVWLTWRFL